MNKIDDIVKHIRAMFVASKIATYIVDDVVDNHPEILRKAIIKFVTEDMKDASVQEEDNEPHVLR